MKPTTCDDPDAVIVNDVEIPELHTRDDEVNARDGAVILMSNPTDALQDQLTPWVEFARQKNHNTCKYFVDPGSIVGVEAAIRGSAVMELFNTQTEGYIWVHYDANAAGQAT